MAISGADNYYSFNKQSTPNSVLRLTEVGYSLGEQSNQFFFWFHDFVKNLNKTVRMLITAERSKLFGSMGQLPQNSRLKFGRTVLSGEKAGFLLCYYNGGRWTVAYAIECNQTISELILVGD